MECRTPDVTGQPQIGCAANSFDATLCDLVAPTPGNFPHPHLTQTFYQICTALGTNFPCGGLDTVVAFSTTAQGLVVFLGAAAVFVGDDALDRLAVFGVKCWDEVLV